VDDEGCAIGNIGEFYSHTGPGHLYKILEEIEARGYEVQAVSIPACAVNAPHKRERYWIIARQSSVGLADSNGDGRSYAGDEINSGEAGKPAQCDNAIDYTESVADTECQRQQRGSTRTVQTQGAQSTASRLCDWSDSVWLPCADGKVRRAPDDTIILADGIPLELFEGLAQKEEAQPSASLIAALGNSIVPEVARRIIQAMVDADNG
jgi:site-specific DNA-cytosine methylase